MINEVLIIQKILVISHYKFIIIEVTILLQNKVLCQDICK